MVGFQVITIGIGLNHGIHRTGSLVVDVIASHIISDVVTGTQLPDDDIHTTGQQRQQSTTGEFIYSHISDAVLPSVPSDSVPAHPLGIECVVTCLYSQYTPALWVLSV